MSVIGLIGPHAVGKTTAVRRWVNRYSGRIRAVSLDDDRRAYPDNDAKRSLVAELRDSPTVGVLESARGFAAWVGTFGTADPVIVLTCPEPAGRAWLEERRARKGKGPLSAYWTTRRLDYECNGYLLKYVGKHLAGRPFVRHFVIEDRARDWPAVDEHFYSLYRRLRNAANRRMPTNGG